jgi:hypothetical protein
LEQTDFAGLKAKLEGYNIPPKLVRALLTIWRFYIFYVKPPHADRKWKQKHALLYYDTN